MPRDEDDLPAEDFEGMEDEGEVEAEGEEMDGGEEVEVSPALLLEDPSSGSEEDDFQFDTSLGEEEDEGPAAGSGMDSPASGSSSKSKAKLRFKCRGCDYRGEKSWNRKRCPGCGFFYNCVQVKKDAKEAKTLAQKPKKTIKRVSTGIPQLDKIFGGNENEGYGLVRGTCIYFHGESGAGKTTLLMQIIDHICKVCSKPQRKAIYGSSEQNDTALEYVASRVGVVGDNIIIKGNAECVDELVQESCEELKPIVLVVDSVAMAYHSECDGGVNSPSQLMYIASYLNSYAQQRDIIIFLVGHRTKGGDRAGPEMVKHAVDVILSLDIIYGDDGKPELTDSGGGLRTISTEKNRYGKEHQETDLEMLEDGSGLRALEEPPPAPKKGPFGGGGGLANYGKKRIELVRY